MKKALIIYYSQSGQLKDILDSVTSPLLDDFELVFEELKPRPEFPFPWNGMPFFQVFPECVQEIPCELEPFGFNPEEDFDLIILGIQVWYLSPSIPVGSFLQSKAAGKVMKGKPVITIQGVRNMWTMSNERVKKRIIENGGKLIGNIVLNDPYPNLVSVVTIVRWMMKGERQGKGFISRLFPRSGVPEKDVNEAVRFGKTIVDSFQEGSLQGLQARLVKQGAVRINPVIVTVEKRGFAMFGIWSKFILKKGPYNDPAREGRLNLFKYYLFAVIYLASPFGSVIIWLIHKITPGKTRQMIEYFSGITRR